MEGACALTFSVAEAAELYGKYGYRVFPICPRSKMPLVGKGGFHNATTDQFQILGWWKRWPHAMIGVACGGANRLVILDIDVKDGKNGLQNLRRLEVRYGKLPIGPVLKTPSGGLQMLFTAPPGVRIINNASQFAPDIDVRGSDADGTPRGYGTLPPSVRSTGEYEWVDSCNDIIMWGMMSQELPEMPRWALFLAMFNRRRRNILATHGIRSFEDFGDIPPEQWVAHADQLCRPNLVASAGKPSTTKNPSEQKNKAHIHLVPDVPLDEVETAHILRYVEASIANELEPIQTIPPGAQETGINEAALKVHSLLKGAEALGIAIGSLEDKYEREYSKSIVRMAAGDKSNPWSLDDAKQKWLRTKADAAPRDLTHLLHEYLAKDFEPLDDQKSSGNKNPNGAVFVEDADLDANINWLFDDVLAEECVAFLSGKSSTGKSAIMVHMALALAKGKPFFGRDVPNVGGTYIVAAEHGYAIPARIRAATNDSMAQPIAYNRTNTDLLDPGNHARLVEDIRKIKSEMKERYGVPLKLVFIDTFSRAFLVDDENSSAQITKAFVALADIAEQTGTTIVAVHHYGKDVRRGMRGSSAFRGHADYAIVVESKNNNRSLRLEKGRDAPEGPIGNFTLPTVAVGTKPNGKPILQVYVKECHDFSDLEQDGAPKVSTRALRALHEAFADITSDQHEEIQSTEDSNAKRAVPISRLEERFIERYRAQNQRAGKTLKLNSIKRAFQRLRQDGAVQSQVRGGIEYAIVPERQATNRDN